MSKYLGYLMWLAIPGNFIRCVPVQCLMYLPSDYHPHPLEAPSGRGIPIAAVHIAHLSAGYDLHSTSLAIVSDRANTILGTIADRYLLSTCH